MATEHCVLAADSQADVTTCPSGCLTAACCTVSEGGEAAHRCLSQLLKRLGRDTEDSDKCGGCKTKLKEIT